MLVYLTYLIPVVFSVALFIIANRSYGSSKWPKGKILLTGLGFVPLGLCLYSLWWPILLQAFLCALFTTFRTPSSNLLTPHQYRIASAGSTLFVYALAGLMAFVVNSRFVQLRNQYPLESLEERLAGTNPLPAKDLSEDAINRLTQTERAIGGTSGRRGRGLRMLHEEATMLFVQSSGFGQARMYRFAPDQKTLAWGEREPIPQPGDLGSVRRSIDEAEPIPPCWYEMGVDDLHEKSIVDFANPEGFGYFQDRRHVAGFRAHGFSQVPNADQPLRVTSIELVGLLREQPVVYVSENLPRMDELRLAPTRDLDEFERAGLDALKKGDDLYTRKIEGGLRMLGAIRSTNQCIDCHGGQRGDLLGAFSYMLR